MRQSLEFLSRFSKELVQVEHRIASMLEVHRITRVILRDICADVFLTPQ